MTRKDYIKVADAIWEGFEPFYNAGNTDATALVLKIVENLAKSFQLDNPRFDRTRFVNRCFGIK